MIGTKVSVMPEIQCFYGLSILVELYWAANLSLHDPLVVLGACWDAEGGFGRLCRSTVVGGFPAMTLAGSPSTVSTVPRVGASFIRDFRCFSLRRSRLGTSTFNRS